MRRSNFLFFIQQSFRDLGQIFFISISLAAVILFVIVLLRQPGAKIEVCDSENFIYNLNLIAPSQLGVSSWQIGDYARYRHQKDQTSDTDKFDREVGFHIISELNRSGSQGYWMRKTGFSYYKSVPEDFYRYVMVNDLRITPKNSRYELLENYVPFIFDYCNQTDVPLAKLINLGKAEIQTQAGTFECIHYRAELRAGKSIEIWGSALVPPLGIVRLHSETDTLELVSYGNDTEITIPKSIQPVIEGISTLEHGCTSCHPPGNCHESIFPPK